MALKIEFYIEGEEAEGPIDLEASLAKLRAMLEQANDAKRTVVTLRLSPQFGAHQLQSALGWDPQQQLSWIWDSREWAVRAIPEPTTEDDSEDRD